MTTNETIDGLQEIIDRNQKTILPRVHIGYLIYAVKYLKEQKEEIENLKQTAQSMMEGICLLKEPEAVEPTINEDGEAYCICGENVGIIPRSKNLPSIRSKYCSECGRRMKWKYD